MEAEKARAGLEPSPSSQAEDNVLIFAFLVRAADPVSL
jgi:hypothetical protein